MDSSDIERAAKFANEESLDILWNALHSALEADLSGLQWPTGTKEYMEKAEFYIETMIEVIDGQQ